MEPSTIPELLAFRAPWLEERLVKDRIASSREEAAQLFDEVKKYLVLSQSDRSRQIPMFSRLIDEVWHQLILFTKEYAAFGVRFFGEMLHHSPRTAPSSKTDERRALIYEQFRAEYEVLFGPISSAWRDELALTPDTRLVQNPFDPPLRVRVEDGRAELVWSVDPPKILVRIDAWAAEALRFIAEYDHFYIREIPGLGDPDRLALCHPLVKDSCLRRVP